MAGAGAQGDPGTAAALRNRSSRTPARVRAALEAWLGDVLGAGADPWLADVRGTEANGQSSETFVVDAEWTEDGARRHERLVVRVAPAAGDAPVFPSYDLTSQYETIRAVGERSTVPVPGLRWNEPRTDVLGSPFFVMDHVEGDVAPDVMPYTFGDNWLADATDADRATLQDAVVDLLVALHGIDDAPAVFARVAPPGPGPTALARRVAQARAWYDFAARDTGRSPLIERAFAWLEDRWPRDPGPTVLSWGDARIGNLIVRDFRPVATLDWEMAALGPRELDLGWLIYSHRIFQDFAEQFELPGLPAFLRPGDVVGEYARRSGHDVRDLEPYLALAAVQWAIVLLRVGARQVRFGELAPPGEVDELLHNREGLAAILAGTYWT